MEEPVSSTNELSKSAPLEKSLGVIKKPVEAVLMRPVKGKITLQARRFFNVLLKHAQSSSLPAAGTYYRIPLPRFLSDSAFESRNIAYVVDVLNGMMATVVNWGDTPEKFKNSKANWKGATLLAFAELDKSPKGTFLVFDLHSELRRRFSEEEPFAYAKVSLDVNAAVSSHAALALYELGQRYLTSPASVSKREPWRTWIAPLTGNPDLTESMEYKYFYRDVLKPGMAEVNALQSAFEISLEVEKVHRKVEFLQFIIQRKASQSVVPPTPPLAGIEVASLPVIGRLIQWGCRQNNAEELLRKYGPERVQQALDYTEQRSEQVKAPLAYAKKLMEQGDFLPSVTPPAAPKAHAPAESLAQNLLKAYKAAKRQEAKAVYLEAPPAAREDLLVSFEDTGLLKQGDLYQGRWHKFRQTSNTEFTSPFLEYPFIEWLAGDNLQVTHDALYQWAADTGIISLPLVEKV